MMNNNNSSKYSSQTKEFQKPKNRRKTLLRLLSYVSYYKKVFILAIVLSLVSNALSLIGPYLTGEALGLFDASHIDIQRVLIICAIMACFYIFSAVFNYILAIIMAKVSQKVINKMRSDLFNKLASLPLKNLDTMQIGDLIARMSYDIDAISVTLSTDFVSIFTSVFTIIISFIMMLIISPWLSLIFFVTIPITVLVTSKMSKKIRFRMRLRNNSLGVMNGYVEEMISGIKTIQSYSRQADIVKSFAALNEEAANKTYDAGYVSSVLGPTTNFINNISVGLVGILGVVLFIFKLIMFGPLASFILYSRRFSGPINNISSLYADIQSSLAATERIFSILDLENEEEIRDVQASLNLTLHGNVEMKHVDFSYDLLKPILKDINIEKTLGKKVAIVGPTGSGKTTIISLLMRFYNIDKGDILVDDHSIYDLERNLERGLFTMVLQDSWFFYGTIKENLTYGNKNVSEEEIISTCQSVGIHSYIMSLKDGYDTILVEDGINISKGQKQLLTVCRAILSKSKILILDEATSNVDTATELKINKAMLKLMENRTSFIIAHRLSTIKTSDIILVLKDGQIVERGSHQELLALNGFYRQLYNSQFD
ncbi:MAG: ABC transporter ATP-binding protein/permease [Acholeplasmatales bacterium]|nr:ABC transporter ATP-binding protein/permease [Acholeplasmatales bacterium]